MQPDDIRLHHLIEAASKAVNYASLHERNDLDSDEILRLALIKLVEIVGEAAKQTTEETRSQYKDVPWSAAARMRDRLVHHYFDIDHDVLWTTITVELPKLLDQLREPPRETRRFGITNEWQPVALLLERLVQEISAWSAVVLIPKQSGDALHCAAHYCLPDDWAKLDNRLDSGSLNATAYLSQKEVVDNTAQVTTPPTDGDVSHHPITASAVVLVPGVGTLEVLANRHGYKFEHQQLQAMRDAATEITLLIGKS